MSALGESAGIGGPRQSIAVLGHQPVRRAGQPGQGRCRNEEPDGSPGLSRILERESNGVFSPVGSARLVDPVGRRAHLLFGNSVGLEVNGLPRGDLDSRNSLFDPARRGRTEATISIEDQGRRHGVSVRMSLSASVRLTAVVGLLPASVQALFLPSLRHLVKRTAARLDDEPCG